jgi:hypothetical protein
LTTTLGDSFYIEMKPFNTGKFEAFAQTEVSLIFYVSLRDVLREET